MDMEAAGLSKTHHVRCLSEADIGLVYALCRGNLQYYRYHPPLATEDSIRADMRALPPGKDARDKYYVGYFAGDGAPVAVMDLILGYPQEQTAFIGFFMVAAAHQGTGLGSALVGEAMEYLRSLGYTTLRLGVDKGNPQSLAFWKKNGFTQVDEGQYIVMERKL